ncbi:MAG: C4-type zinc ribbon domain-containing protein [Candidatus Omnitrophica bacterium]|nr:C4-type zinc ribbon domain-containing protein [Candidatus Omnitrophota bacterium]
MASVNLKEQLDGLIQLQAVDTKIYAFRDEKEKRPKEIEALKASFEENKSKVAEAEKVLLDLQKKRKDKELELASKEEGVKKLQSQLYTLKTNKEYQTMLQQIQDTKADASVIEDGILTIFDQIDKEKGNIEKERIKLQEEEKKMNSQIAQVQDRIKEIEGHLAQFEAERARIVPHIDARILAQYERILLNRDGLAIVSVKDNTCQGCNMYVPPQVINLIKMYERIITCEVCNRILYTAE